MREKHPRGSRSALTLAALGVVGLVAGVTVAVRASPSVPVAEFNAPASSAPTLRAPIAPAHETTATTSPSTAAPPASTVAPAVAVQPPPPVERPPTELVFPRLEVVAPVIPVGVLDSGSLQIPDDPGVVGWWSAGAALGSPTGNLVLVGHVDSARLGVGALKALLELAPDDVVGLRDHSGALLTYRVNSRHTVPKSELASELFTQDGPPTLVLITCGGAFDERRGHYADNVVVIATPA